MGKLDGKVEIVTGAARGLGRAYAKRLGGLGEFLATDLSDYVTGAVIPIDGGLVRG